ncbi:hypothetical protein JOM56_015510 [Amanita muscaria]
MGVAGLWDVLKPAAETRSMTNLAITDGFLANPQGLRGFRIGIDASISLSKSSRSERGGKLPRRVGKQGRSPALPRRRERKHRNRQRPTLRSKPCINPKTKNVKLLTTCSREGHYQFFHPLAALQTQGR